MDYSLLLGVALGRGGERERVTVPSAQAEALADAAAKAAPPSALDDGTSVYQYAWNRNHGGLASRVPEADGGGALDETYYIARIIDILQKYDMRKKCEKACCPRLTLKGQDPTAVSVQTRQDEGATALSRHGGAGRRRVPMRRNGARAAATPRRIRARRRATCGTPAGRRTSVAKSAGACGAGECARFQAGAAARARAGG